MYDCCKVLYTSELKVFQSVIGDFPQEEQQMLLKKLDPDEKAPPCRVQLEFCLTEWANRLSHERDNSLRLLS